MARPPRRSSRRESGRPAGCLRPPKRCAGAKCSRKRPVSAKGIRREYAGLLQAAGVDTVKDLKYRNPANLAKAMADANRKRRLVAFLPSAKVVENWIENAKKLQLKITYK